MKFENLIQFCLCCVVFLQLVLPATPTQAQTDSFVIDESESKMMTFEIPLSATTQIRIAEDRIQNVVFDKKHLNVQTNDFSGEIYVRPLLEQESVVFLTTGSRKSLAIKLVPSETAEFKTVVLRNAQKVETDRHTTNEQRSSLPRMTQDAYTEKISVLVADVFNNEDVPYASKKIVKSSEQLEKGAFLVSKALHPLHVRPSREFLNNEFKATHMYVSNGTLKTYQIDDEAVLKRHVLAVGITKKQIAPAEQIEIVVVESTFHD